VWREYGKKGKKPISVENVKEWKVFRNLCVNIKIIWKIVKIPEQLATADMLQQVSEQSTKKDNNQQPELFSTIGKTQATPSKKKPLISFKWAVACLDKQLLLNGRGAAKANPLSLVVFSFGKPRLSFKANRLKANRLKDNGVKAAKSFS
jgi:hypothetical protein